MTTPSVNGQNLSFNQLVQFKNEVNTGTQAKYLDVQAGQLFAKKNTNGATHKETTKNGRQRMLETKQFVRSALASEIGSKTADRLMQGNRIQTHTGTGLGKKADGTAISTAQLGGLTRSVYAHKRDQGIRQLTPEQRTSLSQSMNPPTRLNIDRALADPKLSPILMNHMHADSASENLEIYGDLKELKSLHAEYDRLESSNGSSIQKKMVTQKIREQTRAIAKKIGTEKYNVGSAANLAFGGKTPRYTDDQIRSMGIADLRKLLRGGDGTAPDATSGPLGKGMNAARGNLTMNYDTFKVEFQTQVQSLGNSTDLDLLHASMNDGAHLRSDGKGLWSKASHGKVKLLSRGRAEKFRQAKVNVQASLTKLVGKQQAERIMQPFLASKDGLTKADLGKIITAANASRNADRHIDRLARRQSTKVPMMTDLASRPQDDWTRGLQAFAASRGNTTFAAQLQIAQLENDLPNAVMDSGPDMSGRARKSVPLDEDAFQRAQQGASSLLQRRDLPSGLRRSLRSFVQSSSPPSDNNSLISQLRIYRQTNLGTGQLHQDFQAAVTTRKNEIQSTQAQQQPLSQPRSSQPSLQQTGPARRQTVSPDLGVFNVNMNDIDETDFEPPSMSNSGNKGMHEEPEIEKSYTYNGGHDPIVPGASNSEIEIDYEIDN